MTEIFLTGFMGAGKTTVGRLLAERLGRPFQDLDQVIEARAGRTVRQIFEAGGEPLFRRLEHEALAALLARETGPSGAGREGPRAGGILATGGGTVTVEANRRLLAGGVTLWLHPPFEVLVARITGGPSGPAAAGAPGDLPGRAVELGSGRPLGRPDRPLFGDETAALALYRQRLPIYRQAADLELPVAADEAPGEVAARAALLLEPLL